MSKTAAARTNSRLRPRDTYGTPRPFWLALDHEFHFTVDVAADHAYHMTPRYYTPDENGLLQSWAGEVVWCNPPYSDIAPWVAMARAERENGATTVLLLPARTDSPWWHEHVWGIADEIRWCRGRLRFLDKGSAPHASVLVIYRSRKGE